MVLVVSSPLSFVICLSIWVHSLCLLVSQSLLLSKPNVRLPNVIVCFSPFSGPGRLSLLRWPEGLLRSPLGLWPSCPFQCGFFFFFFKPLVVDLFWPVFRSFSGYLHWHECYLVVSRRQGELRVLTPPSSHKVLFY